MTSQRDLINRVRRAIEDPGVRPDYHRAQLRQLQQNWPTLYRAIMRLITESENTMRFTHEDLLSLVQSLQRLGIFHTVTNFDGEDVKGYADGPTDNYLVIFTLEHDRTDGTTYVMWNTWSNAHDIEKYDIESDGIMVESPTQVRLDVIAQLEQHLNLKKGN